MNPNSTNPNATNQRPAILHHSDIKGYRLLEELAVDLLWSWIHNSDKIWKRLDAELWEQTHNPWVVLQTVSREKVKTLLEEPDFYKMVSDLVENNRKQAELPAWFQQAHSESKLSTVAYFSMEYMLSEALPIYSGGLGNVAGDQLKAASDLGVPVIAIGLLYQKGYFRQTTDRAGMQHALYPFNEPGQLPIKPLRQANGAWLRLEVKLPGHTLWLRTWEVKIGKLRLLLLDSNDAANSPIYRGITGELYGGGSELRLQQEILLGIGGYRLLHTLGINPEVCHLNEGHAAFALLERSKFFMEEHQVPFEVALSTTRAGNLFTTHTAVSAGFDRFSAELIDQYLGRYIRDSLKISMQDFMALGRQNPHDMNEQFNMAYLAIRGSGAVNGVSKLHGRVSRHLFQPLFPRLPAEEVPIGYVTNGVHTPSWDSIQSDRLWTAACGPDRWIKPTEELQSIMRNVPDEQIWEMRNKSRQEFVDFGRQRTSKYLETIGAPPERIATSKTMFDPNILTLGFARRFATYKRPNLLLHDPERLIRILRNSERPVQLVLAGKAHPADVPGQLLIQQWIQFLRRAEVWPRVMFLTDYDMYLTEQLVKGVDVWINTPKRPWEACGTSGMKVLVNGGLNLSELDGWWAEAFCPEVGWSIGDGQEHYDDPMADASDALELYDTLENKVIPEFYRRDANNIPAGWISKIRESMARLTPQYSANRAVREYTEKYYIPLADNYVKRTCEGCTMGKKLIDWKRDIDQKWSGLSFASFDCKTVEGKHQFEAKVFVDSIDPRGLKVELYAEGLNGSLPIHQEMTRGEGANNTFVYRATLSGERPASDYTPRVVPHFEGVAVPLEADEILWQR
jgi:starch phosphorylase